MTSSSLPNTSRENIKFSNPFPGLRPFTPEESHLFYGREKQGEAILEQLSANRFVALIGASGSGKSSLIYCGLVSHLKQGNLEGTGTHWNIIATRPGSDPLLNLAKAMRTAILEKKSGNPEEKAITSRLESDPDAIQKLLKDYFGEKQGNTLVIIDQFEELFRYADDAGEDKGIASANRFVDLLVNAVKNKDYPVYAVLTMRSDFIGDCSQFQNLTALINQSNYLIPRMSRQDLEKAITGPVQQAGATIDPDLTAILLNEIGNNPDQLPILQHALMRTWEYWLARGDVKRPIAMADYEAIGKMEKALSEHANEAYDELDEEGKRVCENMFKTLTEKGTDNRGIRHPTRVSVIASIVRTTPENVMSVVDKFRGSSRSFLSPAANVPLTPETIIDLSHESIMRIWNRLRVWVEEEAAAVQMYLRLSEAAAQHQAGRGSLWRPPDLQLALNWKEKQQPTLAWAARFDQAFERTMVFLSTSESDFNKEEEHKIRLQKRQLRRTRMFALVLGSAAIIALGLTVYSQMLRAEALKQESLAKIQQHKADSNAVIAQEQEKIAKDALVEAQLQKVIAENQKMTADSQRTLAVSNAQKALAAQKIANEQKVLAEQQSRIAQENAKKAEEQSKIAKENSDLATRRRMLSIAQSMSVKSLQIDQDKNLKGLVAYQAYLFNKENEGPSRQADIYTGLYNAMKSLSKPGFNVLRGHQDKVQNVLFLPGSNIAFTSGTDGQVLRWDLSDTNHAFQTIAQNKALNEALAISPDGNWLASATDGVGIELFDLKNPSNPPKVIRTISRNTRSMAFSFDNLTLFSAGSDNSLYQWDIRTQAPKLTLPVGDRLNRLSLSPDGQMLAGATRDGKVILWNTRDSMSKRVFLSDRNDEIISLAFGNNGKWLATGALSGVIKIWNTDNGQLIATLTGHSARVQDLAFSPDNKVLGSVSYDASVRLWDMGDFSNPPVVLRDNGGYVMSIAFSSDSKIFLTGSFDEDRLVVRPSSAEIMADQIKTKISRNMSQDEWKSWVGVDIPYRKTCNAPDYSIGIE